MTRYVTEYNVGWQFWQYTNDDSICTTNIRNDQNDPDLILPLTINTPDVPDIYAVNAWGDLTAVTMSSSEAATGGDPEFDQPIDKYLTLNAANSWAGVFRNLDKDDANYTYTYGVREISASPGFEFMAFIGTTMNDGQSTVNPTSNAAAHGGTITVQNKKLESVSVQVSKKFILPTGVDIPAGFKITAEWGTDPDQQTVELTPNGDYPSLPAGVTVTEDAAGTGTDQAPFLWTISGLPLGTAVTFTESGYGISGYNTLTTVVDADGTRTGDASGTATAAAVPGTVAFTNAYAPGVTLPETGGPGTAAFSLAGAAMTLGAALILLRRRRRAG